MRHQFPPTDGIKPGKLPTLFSPFCSQKMLGLTSEGVAEDEDDSVATSTGLPPSREGTQALQTKENEGVESPEKGLDSPPPKTSILYGATLTPAKSPALEDGNSHSLSLAVKEDGTDTNRDVQPNSGTPTGTPYPTNDRGDQKIDHRLFHMHTHVYPRSSRHSNQKDDDLRHFWDNEAKKEEESISWKALIGLSKALGNDTSNERSCLGIRSREEEGDPMYNWTDNGPAFAKTSDVMELYDVQCDDDAQTGSVPPVETITGKQFYDLRSPREEVVPHGSVGLHHLLHVLDSRLQSGDRTTKRYLRRWVSQYQRAYKVDPAADKLIDYSVYVLTLIMKMTIKKDTSFAKNILEILHNKNELLKESKQAHIMAMKAALLVMKSFDASSETYKSAVKLVKDFVQSAIHDLKRNHDEDRFNVLCAEGGVELLLEANDNIRKLRVDKTLIKLYHEITKYLDNPHRCADGDVFLIYCELTALRLEQTSSVRRTHVFQQVDV